MAIPTDNPPHKTNNLVGKFAAILIAIVFMAILSLWGQIFEHLDAGEYLVVQYPNGHLVAYTEPGYKWQWFGTVSHFKRSAQFWFSSRTDEGSTSDQSIRTRFNDGGHANISGSVRFDLPTTEANLLDLYRTYHTQAAVEHELISTIISKAVYMTGPIMSSKESYAEKRNDLINFIEDQAAYGVYQTVPRETTTIDPITQQQKTVTMVEVKRDTSGKIMRQEDSPLVRFGIHLYNLNINEVKYDAIVEEQIATQQKAIMQVQTAIANSKQAEQEALTAKSQGEAEAAKAKWEQEVIKAREVTKAEQEKAVAELNANRDKAVAETAGAQRKVVAQLDKEAAEFKKAEQIALGEGEAARKKLAMEANGALEAKLDAWVAVNKGYADAFREMHVPLVPSVVMTGSGGQNGQQASGAIDLIEMLKVKTAKDLAIDFNVQSTANPPKP